MGHDITAILVHGTIDPVAAERFDLRPVTLGQDLALLHIDHYFAAYWQATERVTELLDVPLDFPPVFPREGVLRHMVVGLKATARPAFGIVMTDYFGGTGSQWACAFEGTKRITGDATKINATLRALGITHREPLDEFDTVGLDRHRSPPQYLERYVDLCDDLGV
jgi:hypothetical protein